MPARVTHVSRDALQDEKLGLVYAVRVVLDAPFIVVDGKRVAITPGMASGVKIRTGTRRVIDYLLSPLLQHAHEALHER